MDWQSLLYDPVYSVLGVPAVLVLDGTDGAVLDDLTVLDKTAGVDVGGDVDVQTVLPAAVVRAPELVSIDLEDLEDASLTVNAKTWRVKSYRLKPSPKCEGDGEVFLILSEF